MKLSRGVSGLGNALVGLGHTEADLRSALELEDPDSTVDDYLAALDEGGIVEELIEGADLRSPSVQLRVTDTPSIWISPLLNLAPVRESLLAWRGRPLHGGKNPRVL